MFCKFAQLIAGIFSGIPTRGKRSERPRTTGNLEKKLNRRGTVVAYLGVGEEVAVAEHMPQHERRHTSAITHYVLLSGAKQISCIVPSYKHSRRCSPSPRTKVAGHPPVRQLATLAKRLCLLASFGDLKAAGISLTTHIAVLSHARLGIPEGGEI